MYTKNKDLDKLKNWAFGPLSTKT